MLEAEGSRPRLVVLMMRAMDNADYVAGANDGVALNVVAVEEVSSGDESVRKAARRARNHEVVEVEGGRADAYRRRVDKDAH